MPRKNFCISFLILLVLILTSCATNTTTQTTNDKPNNLQVSSVPSDDISFLNGTIWEYETQIGDFTAWRCISIEDGRAMYYMRMGNAIDADPNTAAVYLQGDIITFTKDDGSAHKGQIIGDTILLDERDIYTKLP